MIQAVRGTKDLLSGEIEYYQYLEQLAHKVFSAFDYDEIRTPLFEMTNLFVRSIGEETDIVSKEMYTFQDKKGRSLTLRPEGTAPVVRAIIEHNLLQDRGMKKFYYIGPMFRYERPQFGRQRQFYQIGVEIFGCAEPSADAEVISLSSYFLEQVGFKDFATRVNTVGCPECRKEYNKLLRTYLNQRENELCDDCKRRAKINPLRVFDCKNSSCKKAIADAPKIKPNVCEKCAEHFNGLLRFLDALKVKYVVDENLVRGFDYYTRTVFETVLSGLGAQDAVLGGGRYDNLVAELGGPPTPGIGMSFGVERLVLAMKNNNISLPEDFVRKVDCYVIALEETALMECTKIADMLRRMGKRTRFDGTPRSLKSGLRSANRSNARFALIIGEQELNEQTILIKDLQSGKQEHIPCDALTNWANTLN